MDHEWIWADFFVLARWSLRGRCVVFFHLAQRASIEYALCSFADLVVLLRKFEEWGLVLDEVVSDFKDDVLKKAFLRAQRASIEGAL